MWCKVCRCQTLTLETINHYSEFGKLTLTTNDIVILGDSTKTAKCKWTGEKSVINSIYSNDPLILYIFEPINKGAMRKVNIGEIIHAKGTHTFTLLPQFDDLEEDACMMDDDQDECHQGYMEYQRGH